MRPLDFTKFSYVKDLYLRDPVEQVSPIHGFEVEVVLQHVGGAAVRDVLRTHFLPHLGRAGALSDILSTRLRQISRKFKLLFSKRSQFFRYTPKDVRNLKKGSIQHDLHQFRTNANFKHKTYLNIKKYFLFY